jgi:hypothetical protein
MVYAEALTRTGLDCQNVGEVGLGMRGSSMQAG